MKHHIIRTWHHSFAIVYYIQSTETRIYLMIPQCHSQLINIMKTWQGKENKLICSFKNKKFYRLEWSEAHHNISLMCWGNILLAIPSLHVAAALYQKKTQLKNLRACHSSIVTCYMHHHTTPSLWIGISYHDKTKTKN